MLAKKMIRDIRNHKIQFISIFLMAFLGVYVFVGFGAESFGFEQTADTYYNETNLADGWIYTSNLDDDFVDKVNNLSLTKDSEKKLIVDSIADLENNPDISCRMMGFRNSTQLRVRISTCPMGRVYGLTSVLPKQGT